MCGKNRAMVVLGSGLEEVCVCVCASAFLSFLCLLILKATTFNQFHD